MTTRTVQEIRAELAEARTAVSLHVGETKRLIQIERDRIEAHRRPVAVTLSAKLSALNQELRDAEDRDARANRHEWDGKKVYREEKIYGRYGSGVKLIERIEGIVETVTRDTEFAENLGSWRRPALGAPIVRLLKKDGTPGKKFERLNNTGFGDTQWLLVGGPEDRNKVEAQPQG